MISARSVKDLLCNPRYNESLAGARTPGWVGVSGPRTIDPLKEDGTLIKYVSNISDLAPPGEADVSAAAPFASSLEASRSAAQDALMAFQHRLCVSGDPVDVPWGRVPWPKPPNYDPEDFLILQRAIEAGDTSPYQAMPPSEMRAVAAGACKRKKYTVCCGISVVASDQPTLNKGWANASWERKQEITAEHTYFELGSLYYLANDPKVPAAIREKFSKFGLCRDEFQDYGYVPPQLYIRISNRLVGAYVMTQNNMPPISPGYHPDGIATGSWSFDEHMTGKYAVPLGNGSYVTQLEGNFWPNAGPYDVPFGALTPKKGTGGNLMVPVCLSASAVAYSSTRIETMFMATGTAAGVAAKQLVDGAVRTVQEVNVTLLQDILVTQFDTAVHHGGGGGGGGGGGCPGNSSAPTCKAYTASGAATAAANGIYKYDGGQRYGMPLFQNADGYMLYRYDGQWRLVVNGHLVYTGPPGNCSQTPEPEGWSVCKPSRTQNCKIGKAPAPTIRCTDNFPPALARVDSQRAPPVRNGSWECYSGQDNHYKLSKPPYKLKDADISSVPDLQSCKDRCTVSEHCVVVVWHKSDSHCHVLTGPTVTAAQFVATLQPEKESWACFNAQGHVEPLPPAPPPGPPPPPPPPLPPAPPLLPYGPETLPIKPLGSWMVIGDWGGEEEDPFVESGQLALARQMGSFAANASTWSPVSDFVGLGDNFYTCGINCGIKSGPHKGTCDRFTTRVPHTPNCMADEHNCTGSFLFLPSLRSLTQLPVQSGSTMSSRPSTPRLRCRTCLSE